MKGPKACFLVPQNAGNGIYTFKIFRGSMPPKPLLAALGQRAQKSHSNQFLKLGSTVFTSYFGGCIGDGGGGY